MLTQGTSMTSKHTTRQDLLPEEANAPEPPNICKGRDRAVVLTRHGGNPLTGACPSCGSTVTVKVDTLYNRQTGSCPACRQSLAYLAPDGTYSTDVVHPSPNIWRIDLRHYCTQCRYEIPYCQCTPRIPVPDNYAEKSRHHWERQRSFEDDPQRKT